VLQREWEIVATATNGINQQTPFVVEQPEVNPALDNEQTWAKPGMNGP
jgi:hypothetical protein